MSKNGFKGQYPSSQRRRGSWQQNTPPAPSFLFGGQGRSAHDTIASAYAMALCVVGVIGLLAILLLVESFGDVTWE